MHPFLFRNMTLCIQSRGSPVHQRESPYGPEPDRYAYIKMSTPRHNIFPLPTNEKSQNSSPRLPSYINTPLLHPLGYSLWRLSWMTVKPSNSGAGPPKSTRWNLVLVDPDWRAIHFYLSYMGNWLHKCIWWLRTILGSFFCLGSCFFISCYFRK